jgi:hypothetical protein
VIPQSQQHRNTLIVQLPDTVPECDARSHTRIACLENIARKCDQIDFVVQRGLNDSFPRNVPGCSKAAAQFGMHFLQT